MAQPISFGIKTTPLGASYDQLAAIWEYADRIPVIEHAWLWDHLQPMRGDPAISVLEGWTLLAALAACTRRLGLGLLVSNNLTRHPNVLAKIAATVDQISGGRLVLGIGAGGNLDPESRAFGLAQPPVAERVARLDEACELIDRLWTSAEPLDHRGRYYQVSAAVCSPGPTQARRPPILIGGIGEQLLLRTVARRADIWNAPGPPHVNVTDYVRKNRVLDEYCREVGRSPDQIIRSVQLIIDPDNHSRTLRLVRELTDAGARHFVLALPVSADINLIDPLVAHVIEPATSG